MNPPSEARPESPFAQRFEMLIRVSQAIKAHRGCDELFQALAIELRKVVEFDAIYCIQYDQAANKITWIGSHSPSGIQRPDLSPQEMLIPWIYERQQPLVIPFLDRETR